LPKNGQPFYLTFFWCSIQPDTTTPSSIFNGQFSILRAWLPEPLGLV
jgi:hypothetical protein